MARYLSTNSVSRWLLRAAALGRNPIQAFALVAITHGCAAQSVRSAETESDHHGLASPSEVDPVTKRSYRNLYWTANGNVVPVCWIHDEYSGPSGSGGTFSVEKRILENAIRGTWGAAANLRFDFTDGCPAEGPYVRTVIQPTAMQEDGTYASWVQSRAAVGMGNALSKKTSQIYETSPGWILNIAPNGGSLVDALHRQRIGAAGVHEMGHILGFSHEQNRTDVPPSDPVFAGASVDACGPDTDAFVSANVTVNRYDPDSIMNYCGVFGKYSIPRLSEGDVAAIRKIYGSRPPRPNALIDMDGNGLMEPVAINLDGIYRRSHSDPAVGEPANWNIALLGFGNVSKRVSPAFYGTQETLFGDLNADGTTDIVAIHEEGVFAMTAESFEDGPNFTNWQMLAGNFRGSRKTILADVDGNGSDDLVAISEEGPVLVRRMWPRTRSDVHCLRNCTFDLGETEVWRSSFYGSVSTHAADVNGDGRADLIAFHGSRGVFVALSTGAGFGVEQRWRGPLVSTRSEFVADATGDGLADLLSIDVDGVWVAPSNGSSFDEPATTWRVGETGDRDTLVADVNGDASADLVLVQEQGLDVYLSTGAQFAPAGRWSGPFYSW